MAKKAAAKSKPKSRSSRHDRTAVRWEAEGEVLPRYPIFIPSKGRAKEVAAARMFSQDGVPFKVVVEPQEREAYEEEWEGHVITLPENDRGLVFARNWIKEYSISQGAERHWQFDDDVVAMLRLHKGYRMYCASNVALAVAEDFVERYENVGLASFNSEFFCPANNGVVDTKWPPFYLNSRCYTCFLMLNSLPNRWRFRYNEDTDMTLQVLADGWCTILFNTFLIRTPATLAKPGGQMVSMYGGDGRLKMSRELERVWPGIVETSRRFGRPQHKVKGYWRYFDTKLKRKEGLKIPEGPNEYGLRLVALRDVVDEDYRRLLAEQEAGR